MEFIRHVEWEDVEKTWKKQEDNAQWAEVYKPKGFRNWEDWRRPRIKLWGLDEREWTLYNVQGAGELAQMHCDATTRWSEFYEDRRKSRFSDIKGNEFLVGHPRIQSMRHSFPVETQLIALRDRKRSVIIDGHHRSTAAAWMRPDADLNETRIAISEIHEDERERFNALFSGEPCVQMERKFRNVLGVLRSQVVTRAMDVLR